MQSNQDHCDLQDRHDHRDHHDHHDLHPGPDPIKDQVEGCSPSGAPSFATPIYSRPYICLFLFLFSFSCVQNTVFLYVCICVEIYT